VVGFTLDVLPRVQQRHPHAGSKLHLQETAAVHRGQRSFVTESGPR
jgi:hypothetical protein